MAMKDSYTLSHGWTSRKGSQHQVNDIDIDIWVCFMAEERFLLRVGGEGLEPKSLTTFASERRDGRRRIA